MAIMEGTRELKVWQGNYDFAVDAGAQGTIVLRSNDGPLPNGSVVVGGYLDVTSSCLSATGTMALATPQTAADLLAASAQAALTAGRKDIIPDSTGSTAIKLTAARQPTVDIATADFTAGAFTLVLLYR